MNVLIQILLVAAVVSGTHGFVRMCYFTAWAKTRPNLKARMDIKDIDPFVCTHLVWAFGSIDTRNKELKASNPHTEDGPNGRFAEFTNLKRKNENLKIMLSVGGEKAGSWAFNMISNSVWASDKFAKSAVKFLRARNFDGLDVDWEYPSKWNGHIEMLLKSLRKEFDKDGSGLILAMAMAAGTWTINRAYNLEQIHPLLDYLAVMTYDYHVGSARVASFNSPLYPRPNFHPTLNMEWTINHYLSKTVPASKILVGFTWVGRRLTLANRNNYIPGSAVLPHRQRLGNMYGFPAGLAYPEICNMRALPGAKQYWDETQQCPYLVYRDNFVGYEDEKSIEKKVAWFMPKKVGGIMQWSLDQDDFSGSVCLQGKNPMFKALHRSLEKHGIQVGQQKGGGDAVALPGASTLMLLLYCPLFCVWFQGRSGY